MAALAAALRDYGSSSSDDDSDNNHLEPINTTALVDQKLLVPVQSAPDVLPNVGFPFITDLGARKTKLFCIKIIGTVGSIEAH